MNAYHNCILEETNSPTCFKVHKRFERWDRHVYASHLRRTGKHTWKHSLNDNTCRTR